MLRDIDPQSLEGHVIIFIVAVLMFGTLITVLWAYDKVCTWFEMGYWRDLLPFSNSSRASSYPPVRMGMQPIPVTSEGNEPLPKLAQRDWLDRVNNQPDLAPHLLIVGKSGSGKSTLARAILSSRRGLLAIVTPKFEEAEAWAVPLVTIDPDASFSTINATLKALYSTLLQRTQADTPITIVLDDYTILANDRQCKDACAQLVQAVARLGRSKRVRLLLLTHETTAAATATNGQHALLENFTRIDCERYTHRATLVWDDVRYELDTRNVPALAQRGLAHLATWQPPAPPPVQSVRTSTVPRWDAIEPPDTGTVPVHTSTVPPEAGTAIPPDLSADEAGMIVALYKAGYSKNKIAALLGGSKSTAYARINTALESEVHP
ncbi:MAG: AAA family ATPase [Chloroflexaceae bacterium]|nr:AAA family ATPase [Chloroflexaceae bacterium]